MNKELKTGNEWKNVLYPRITILDLDGFDRENLEFSYYEEKITKEEFLEKFMECTIVTKLDHLTK